MIFNPTNLIDAYKYGHRQMYPKGTTRVYSNFTPRKSRIDGIDRITFLGLQAFLDDLVQNYQDNFFNKDIDIICNYYERIATEVLGPNNIGSDQWRQLHALGYLPLEFKAIPEGYAVPLKVPMFTVENTHDDFFWLPNYIESLLSAAIWLPCTSATTARRFRQQLNEWAMKTTGSIAGVEYQGHDFSFRGMGSLEEAAASGAGHLVNFVGSDTIIAKEWINAHYGPATEPVLNSVAATEHSVMCAGGNGEGEEEETYKNLMDLHPTGILSVVSDTWDLWNVLTVILPNLKPQIMGRDGKLVIRPDSGDPADILCGDPYAEDINARLGVVEILWRVFGGTTNDKGYKVLDSHIGAIYGDSITYERAGDIMRRLEYNGFASTNVVFGIGSYTYRYVTRDTFGFAMKATAVTVDGVDRAIFKDPITDDGTKKSARGRMIVLAHMQREPNDITGTLEWELLDEQTVEDQTEADENCTDWLAPVWRDGNFLVRHTFDEIRARNTEQFPVR